MTFEEVRRDPAVRVYIHGKIIYHQYSQWKYRSYDGG